MEQVSIVFPGVCIICIFIFYLLQINAEEIKDNRVVNFEVQARKLDNKVSVISFSFFSSSSFFLNAKIPPGTLLFLFLSFS